MLICSLFILLGLFLDPLGQRLGQWQGGLRSTLETAASAPSGTEAANDVVRKYGFFVAALCGLGVVALRGWVVWGVIPAQWVSGVGVALGAFMLTFPERYRTLLRNRKR